MILLQSHGLLLRPMAQKFRSNPTIDKTEKMTVKKTVIFSVAEEVGFEPTKGVNPYRFSRAAPSTTQPLLHIQFRLLLSIADVASCLPHPFYS